MKKVILIFLCVLMLCVVGCSTAQDEKYEEIKNTGKVIRCDGVYMGRKYYWTDEETGVQYIILKRAYGIAMTPRLKADGTLYMEEVTE